MTFDILLDTVRNSPSGTPETLLRSLGASEKQLARLVRLGLARTEVRFMGRPKGMSVTWYFPAEGVSLER